MNFLEKANKIKLVLEVKGIKTAEIFILKNSSDLSTSEIFEFVS